MAIKHVTAKHYKENIEIKEKKLNDTSITAEQKKVIKQDLDKLKEKQQKHAEIVEKNFDEQIKAAPKEEQEKLKKEKEAFKSKYVAKEANTEAAEEAKEANTEEAKEANTEEAKEANTEEAKPAEAKPAEAKTEEVKPAEAKTEEVKPDNQGETEEVKPDNQGETEEVKPDNQGETEEVKPDNQGNPETDAKAEEEAKAKEAADKAEAEKAIEDAIEKGKYYGFSKLTVKMFAEAKKIDITALKDEDTSGSVLKFYEDRGGEVQEYMWQKKDTATQKCKVEICKKITESENITTEMSYKALGIGKDTNQNCYNNDAERVKFVDNPTFEGYWEDGCINLLVAEDITIKNASE